MENKIQQLVNELSKNERVQSVIHDVHVLQNKLNTEMIKTLTKFKKSAVGIEKNILIYKKQLIAQKNKLEKELRAKAQGALKAKSPKKAAAAKTTTTAKKKTTRKAVSKKRA
ncbi:MAG: hypothetical protein IPM97_10265 [Bdellovibrionaceae bacterium]|nr:hypothetical protein [Pseudobdellovibrionaceae bacterium]